MPGAFFVFTFSFDNDSPQELHNGQKDAERSRKFIFYM